MKYFFRLIIALYFIYKLVITGVVNAPELAVFYVAAALDIFRLKYKNLKVLIYLEYILIFIASVSFGDFTPLFALAIYDFIELKSYGMLIVTLIALGFLSGGHDISFSLVLCGIAAVYSFTTVRLEAREKLYREMFDKEREYRYQLEVSRKILQNSTRDVARLTEVKERNRIATELHDKLGHSIAGVLMQLQAAKKMIDKGSPGSEMLIAQSIEVMSRSLDTVRNTVHNIKPSANVGIEYIIEILNNFKYCPVKFSHRGDFSKINPELMEAMASTIKELLTNASKYSDATEIDLDININEKFTRLYYKDNGRGCSKIKDGLGLTGIKERVKNVGGSVAISGDKGFTVVCLVPAIKGEN